MMMMTMEGMMDKGVLDDIIRRLLEGRGGKQVQLSEGEIRQLCVNARQVFLSQPTLVEVHAPVRICGQPSQSFSLSIMISYLESKKQLLDLPFFFGCLLGDENIIGIGNWSLMRYENIESFMFCISVWF